MAVVEVNVNGRSYQVACDDGQEEHLADLARQIDRRVKDLARTMGQVGDARLILMAALLVADELAESTQQVDLLKEALDSSRRRGDETAARAFETMAGRLESIAARLESR